jgi:hypothetical protein
MRDATDGTFILENMSTSKLHEVIWIIVEHYNSTATARTGHDGLRAMLVQEGIWNITEADVGDRAFITWSNWTDDNGQNISISNVVFQKSDFTAVVQFDIKNNYPWTFADSIGIARLQAEKVG